MSVLAVGVAWLGNKGWATFLNTTLFGYLMLNITQVERIDQFLAISLMHPVYKFEDVFSHL